MADPPGPPPAGGPPGPPAPAIGPALPGEQQPTAATVPSPPEAATRLFGDVRKGLDKSATGEFGVLQFAVCLVLCVLQWVCALVCLGNENGLHWIFGSICLRARRKERRSLSSSVRVPRGTNPLPCARGRKGRHFYRPAPNEIRWASASSDQPAPADAFWLSRVGNMWRARR